MVFDLRRMVGSCGAVLLLCTGAASAQTPAYITAKPDSATRAFGKDVAHKIFSNAYTPVRQQAVLRSQKTIPGFDCPADPQIALAEVIPYPVKQGAPSWIERYVLGCTPRTMRNFLLMLEGEQPGVIELLAGNTNTDPLLQRDALKGGYTAVGAIAPKTCDKPVVADTRLTSKIERGVPWTERWVFDLCGTKAEVDMMFTPSASSGTSWTATLVK
jgi:hypothetical protein